MSVGQAKLRDAFKELRLRVERTRSDWDDEARKRFERDVIAPLESKVMMAMGAMARLSEATATARRDCSGSSSF